MQVIIPVAGKGTRLRPFTHSVPKPLLHVAGKPVLDWIIDKLEGLDVSEIIFVTKHLKEEFKNYGKTLNYPSRFVEQIPEKGTAAAIKSAEEFIKEPVMIIFADTIFDVDFNIIDFNIKEEDGFIWCKEVEDYQRFGVILQENKVMKKIIEKPSEPISKLANIGLYYLKDYKLLFEGINHIIDSGKAIKGEYFLTDALQYLVDKGQKIMVAEVKEWLDCGKFETTLETNQKLLERTHKIKSEGKNCIIIPPVFIEENCKINNSVIGPNVSLGKNTIINNSVIKDSIIGISSEIQGQVLKDSIIGNRTTIKRDHSKIMLGDDSILE